MEFEVLNEILTTTVGSLFDVTSTKISRKNKDPSKVSNETTERLIKNGKNPTKNEANPKEPEFKKKIEDLLDCWVTNEGPKLFQESMRRLKIDLSRLTRKEMEKMSFENLKLEKKKIKNELKNYDLAFKTAFKRFPHKNEKEPMRPLYIYYKTVKGLLEKFTQGLKKIEANVNIKLEKKELANNGINIAKNNETIKKIYDLKKKRDDLRSEFQKYHSEFLKNNNRKIKYAQDIAPIEQDYKVYKTLKEEIARLEGQLL